MVELRDPELTVETVDEHPGQRRVRVRYALVCEPGDRIVDREIGERISVHAIDEHDAAVRPTREPIVESTDVFTAGEGTTPRDIDWVCRRVDLDVQQDWWSSSPGGDPIPIAEWRDHIVADVTLSMSGRVVAQVRTPVVTGSWGAIGHER